MVAQKLSPVREARAQGLLELVICQGGTVYLDRAMFASLGNDGWTRREVLQAADDLAGEGEIDVSSEGACLILSLPPKEVRQ